MTRQKIPEVKTVVISEENLKPELSDEERSEIMDQMEKSIEREKERKQNKRRTLTVKEKTFADEYLLSMNQSEAARKAGFSAKACRSYSSQLMDRPKVADYIAEKIEHRAIRTEITQDRVIAELAKIAFSDMREFASWGGYRVNFNDSEGLGEISGAIQEISSTDTKDGTNLKIKLHSKLTALELLGRHLKLELSTQRNEIKHSGKLSVSLENMSDDELLAIVDEEIDHESSEEIS